MGPVETLQLGCGDNETTIEEAMAWLQQKEKGDASIELAQELIAASLNMAQGVDPKPIENVLSEARDFLCVLGIGSHPHGELKKTARNLMAELAAFNNGERQAPNCEPVTTAASPDKQ